MAKDCDSPYVEGGVAAETGLDLALASLERISTRSPKP